MINGVPRILIVRLSAVGDVVRLLPALHTLRENYPNAQIDWAVEAKSASIIDAHPALDRVLVFDRPPGWKAATKSFWAFCRRIRANHYDVVIDFHGIFKSGMIAAWSRAPERYGFARPRSRELSFLFTNKRAKLPSPDLNRTEENLMLCDLLCPRRGSLDVTIYVSSDVQEEIDAYFEETFDGGKLVVAMHVPVEHEEKRWPGEYFAELADALLADGRFDVLLTWGPGQLAMVEDVLRRARRNPVVAPETATLKHLAWLLHRAGLYFGGDTGPMHIAAAMGTPVVAVFGGTDPAKHAPYRKPCEVLCVKGDGEGLPPRERLRRVTPEMAYDACVQLVTQ
jgi:lipopolysaccharide heptosyltransferase I